MHRQMWHLGPPYAESILAQISLWPATVKPHTEDDFTAIEDTDELIPRCLVMIDFEEFYMSARLLARTHLALRIPRNPDWPLLQVHLGVSREPSRTAARAVQTRHRAQDHQW
jgi:hypothetical protein